MAVIPANPGWIVELDDGTFAPIVAWRSVDGHDGYNPRMTLEPMIPGPDAEGVVRVFAPPPQRIKAIHPPMMGTHMPVIAVPA